MQWHAKGLQMKTLEIIETTIEQKVENLRGVLQSFKKLEKSIKNAIERSKIKIDKTIT